MTVALAIIAVFFGLMTLVNFILVTTVIEDLDKLWKKVGGRR